MAWKIKGDPDVTVSTVSGVTYGLNETQRTFAQLGIANWSLKFQRGGDDTFTYTVRTQNAKGLGTIVPRDGQVIEVFNDDNDRVFKGHVIRPKLGLKQLSVTVVGPYWWMSKIALSGQSADASNVKDDRTTYAFPEQGLRTSFQTLINRAVDMGVPMKKITDADLSDRISAMFTFLKTTLSNMSFAAAFEELMGCVPDAEGWFDYSGTTPALNIIRRDDMTPLTYSVGATGTTRVESADIYPRGDLEVKRVDLKYMRRETTTGKHRFAGQGAGDASAASAKRKVQIVTVSGPETLAFVPKDDFDRVTLKTRPANFTVNDWFTLDTVLKDAGQRFGGFRGSAGPIVFSGWNLLLSGETPEWLRTDYGLRQKDQRVVGWVEGVYDSMTGLGGCANYLKSIGKLQWWFDQATGQNKFRIYVDFTASVINLAYPTTTTLYKKWDYDFIAPPAGLAANLLAAQSFIPWEGTMTTVHPTISGYNALQRKINLSNSHPDHATMDALVKSVTYKPNQRIEWELGPPPRTDLGGLVNKMRRNPQDNIRWL